MIKIRKVVLTFLLGFCALNALDIDDQEAIVSNVNRCNNGVIESCKELAFTFLSMADMNTSKTYMQKACDLGFKNGCRFIEFYDENTNKKSTDKLSELANLYINYNPKKIENLKDEICQKFDKYSFEYYLCDEVANYDFILDTLFKFCGNGSIKGCLHAINYIPKTCSHGDLKQCMVSLYSFYTQSGTNEFVKEIVSKNKTLLNLTDSLGLYPINYAFDLQIKYKNPDMFLLFLDNGANLNVTSSRFGGLSALQFMTRIFDDEFLYNTLKPIIDKVNVNYQGHAKFEILDIAQMDDKKKAFDLFAQNGANISDDTLNSIYYTIISGFLNRDNFCLENSLSKAEKEMLLSLEFGKFIDRKTEFLETIFTIKSIESFDADLIKCMRNLANLSQNQALKKALEVN